MILKQKQQGKFPAVRIFSLWPPLSEPSCCLPSGYPASLTGVPASIIAIIHSVMDYTITGSIVILCYVYFAFIDAVHRMTKESVIFNSYCFLLLPCILREVGGQLLAIFGYKREIALY